MRPGLKLFFCGLFLALVTLVPAAFGDSYTYTTEGTFLNSGTSVSNFLDPAATLVFTGINPPGVTTFDGVTTSLGTFAFSVLSPGILIGFDYFTLAVNFLAPPGVPGAGYIALVTGNVFLDAGGATITFFPATEQLTAADGSTFTLSLNANPVQVRTGNTPVNVYATITAVPVPEACSLLLLGISGLMLLDMTKRKAAIS
jgi:hypothetical protein